MHGFDFELSTNIHFGKGKIQGLPEEILKFGCRILLVYDVAAGRKSGAYEEVLALCKEHHIHVTEFTGIEQNPKHTAVNEGVRLLKECGAECIVALGGGSTIDTAKAIGFSVFHNGSCWDFYEKKAVVTKMVPVISVPTIAASGSEVSNMSIISNVKEKRKLDCQSDMERPVAAFIDPSYTYSVPPFETACGIISIMSNAYEGYFSRAAGEIQDGISEAIQRSCILHGRRVMACPCSYESRAQLLWSASLAITHLSDCGREYAGCVHSIEHALSAFLDISHGVSLAIASLAWFKYALCDETAPRFARWGRNVWGINAGKDDFAIGVEAVKRFEAFIRELNLPARLSEIGIKIPEKAAVQMAHRIYPAIDGAAWFRPLSGEDDLAEVFRLAC